MRLMSVSGLLLGVVLMGCGSGGGHSDAPDPTLPEATATAPPSPTHEPTPAVTPTPEPEPPFAEVVLGIATVSGAPLPNGGNSFRQYVLRNEGGEWESVVLSLLPADGSVYGVTFATTTVAWAFGGRGEASDGILLRSDDAGRTWRNVSSALPSACPQIFDATFVDANIGYIVARGYFTSPVAFVTTDGGKTWSSVDVPASLGLGGSYALGLRAEAVELAASGGMLTLARLDDPALSPLILDPSGGAGIGANAFSTVESAGWIAACAAILRSAAPGEPWLPQPVDVDASFELRAIDVRGAGHGVAGGLTNVPSGVSPLLLVTDDGASWRAATIADVPEGWTVVDVLRLRGDGAVAVVTDITSGKTNTLLLHSDDGARSWHRDPTGFEHAQIFDLARNSERR
jgi:photosystem II stability/assembly factor-like uncharacterized protein